MNQHDFHASLKNGICSSGRQGGHSSSTVRPAVLPGVHRSADRFHGVRANVFVLAQMRWLKALGSVRVCGLRSRCRSCTAYYCIRQCRRHPSSKAENGTRMRGGGPATRWRSLTPRGMPWHASVNRAARERHPKTRAACGTHTAPQT